VVCGNNHTLVQIKVLPLCPGTESVQAEQTSLPLSVLKGLQLQLACGKSSFAGLLFSFSLEYACHEFKVWDTATPDEGYRSPASALTVREASAASQSILCSPHLACQLPSSFFIYCENKEQCFTSALKEKDLDIFFHKCRATSSSWDSYAKYVLPCFL